MQNPSATPDEVDLLQLLVNVYRFVLKNWLLVVLSLIVTCSVTWLLFQRADRIFESRMVVYSEFLTEAYAAPVVKNLMDLIKEGNAEGLSTKLGLTAEESDLLKKIGVESPTGDRASVREEDKKIFVIVVETTDPAILPKVQAGLIRYFENVEFVKSRTEEKRRGYKNLVERIKLELANADGNNNADASLRPFKTMSTGSKPKVTDAILFDPSTMQIYMQTALNEAEEKLALLKGLEVIDGFSIYKHQIRPKLSIYLASAISSGILLATVLLALRSFQQVLKRYPS